MGNSPLVDYKKISPNKTTPRNHAIDTISIHCYVGQASVEDMGAWFVQTAAQSSCNYGIGSDGRIGMYVEEKDRSWCTSSKSNDNRAITIECASDKTHPYKVNDKVYASLIKLLADICKRNNIKELKWEGDKSLIGNIKKQNMTVHRWFANKACPGDYLYNLHGQIAKEVNALLGSGKEDAKEEPKKETINIHRNVDDTTVKEIAKVVYGEAGIIRSYESLLAVAQCIHDMWKTGEFGRTITKVMKNNFSAYGNGEYTEDACRAVEDVFVNGKRRFNNATILQFRSFTKYSDGNGNMDKLKCSGLLQKYDYIGKDARDNKWGHLYFGRVTKKDDNKEVVESTSFKPYQVKVEIPNLNIRTGAGTSYATTGEFTGIGVFTITEVKEGKGSETGWGKLKSGAGWISLDFTKKI